jgi:hypothetical protein
MVLPEETDIFIYKNANSTEIEFIIKPNLQGIIPVEVKNGTVTNSRSLTAYSKGAQNRYAQPSSTSSNLPRM